MVKDFKGAIDNQKEIILKLQNILKEKIENSSSEELEELTSAIANAAETLNMLGEFERDYE